MRQFVLCISSAGRRGLLEISSCVVLIVFMGGALSSSSSASSSTFIAS